MHERTAREAAEANERRANGAADYYDVVSIGLDAMNKGDLRAAKLALLDAIQQEKYQQVLKIEDLEQEKEKVEQERDKLSLNKGKLESEIAGLKEHAQNLKDKIAEKEETVERS